MTTLTIASRDREAAEHGHAHFLRGWQTFGSKLTMVMHTSLGRGGQTSLHGRPRLLNEVRAKAITTCSAPF